MCFVFLVHLREAAPRPPCSLVTLLHTAPCVSMQTAVTGWLVGLAGWLAGWLTACRWNVKQHILAAASSHRGHQEKVGRSARNVKSVEKRNFRLSQFELHIGRNRMLGLVLITSAEKVPLDFSKVTFLTRISSGH